MGTKEDLCEKGLSHFTEDRWDEAIAELKKALAIDPMYVDALHAISMAYFQKGMLDEAIAEGKKLVAADPDNVLAHTTLALYYQRKGMAPEAEQEGKLAKALSGRGRLQQRQAKKE
jgi:Tfp pilus assembly protein PilF